MKIYINNHYRLIMISVLKVKYIRHFLHAINRLHIMYNTNDVFLAKAYNIHIPITQISKTLIYPYPSQAVIDLLIHQGTIHSKMLPNPNPKVFEHVCMYTCNTSDCELNLHKGILYLIKCARTHRYDFIHAIKWKNNTACALIINEHIIVRTTKNRLYFEYPLSLINMAYYSVYFKFTKNTRVSIILSKLHVIQRIPNYYRLYSASFGSVITPHNLIVYQGGVCYHVFTYDKKCNEECDCATNSRFLELLPHINASNLSWAIIPKEYLQMHI